MIVLDRVTKWYPTKKGRKYVLRDVTARLPAGRHLALIGRNGAGKTTLLRLIGGIDHPNTGAIRSDARISWPVGLTGGFQGSLTGRENARFVCRINGVAERRRMRKALDFIADFAEIGDYFDEPVKTYSAGMRARLGFAVSMAFEFDYYLIDEVMAVGDQAFRRKCEEELARRRGQSTFIVASHNLPVMQRICEMGIVVRNEGIELFHDVSAAVNHYQAYMAATPTGPQRGRVQA